MQGEDNAIEVHEMDHSLKHVVLTGHEDGKVLIWGLDSFIDILFDY